MSDEQLGPTALRAIVRSFSESDAQDLSLELAGTRLRVTKWPVRDGRIVSGASAALPPAPVAASAPAEAEPERPIAASSTVEVRAARLGLFRPAEVARVGAQVAADDSLGSLDVLGSPTPVPAGVTGRVVEVGARDGDLVEYGQVIARIEVSP